MERPLPEFEDPPVVEVALSVQFDPITELRTPQLGLLWAAFRGAFPRIEEHAPLDPMVERFDLSPSPRGGVHIEMLVKPPTPRCWFVNQAGTELIQVQQDRFVRNWRKHKDDEPYPRFEPYIRPKFEDSLREFQRFLSREQLGSIKPNLCEVLYVNHLEAGQGWQNHGELAKILAICRPGLSEELLPEPEELRMSGAFVIPSREDKPLGRLRFEIEPGYRRSDGQPIFRLNVLARGRPEGEGIEGALRFLDVGRKWVVRGFTALTTGEMHRIWGRKQ